MALFGTKKDDEPQSAGADAQQQLLSYGALLAKVNGNTPESLVMPQTFRFSPAKLLRDAWDVSSSAQARDRIEWLLEAGHRAEADHAFAAYQSGNTELLPKPTWTLLNSMKKVMVGATMRKYLMSHIFGRAIVMTDTNANAILTMFHTGHSLGYMKTGIWYLNPIR